MPATDPASLTKAALAFHERGELADAERLYRDALDLDPRHADALHLLGVLLHQQGRNRDAIPLLEQALQAQPDYVFARYNLGIVLQAAGRNLEASRQYRQVLADKPDFSDAANNLGIALFDQGDYAGAASAYRQALATAPDSADVWNNLGNAERALGHRPQAREAYEKVIALEPAHPHAHNNLGVLLLELGDRERAIACFRRALELDPRFSQALDNLGAALESAGRLEEAMTQLEAACALEPEGGDALYKLVHALQAACEWERWGELAPRLFELLSTRPNARISPFHLLAAGASPAEQLVCAKRWASQVVTAGARRGKPPAAAALAGSARLRIGYLSSDFHDHATARLAAGLFECHDRNRFELHAYSYGPDDGSPLRERLRRAFERFNDVRDLGDEALAERIRADGIHLLIDLKGYTRGARLGALAEHPAPVTASYLGYPGTLGGLTDYLIVDRTVVPEGARTHYPERLVFLPDSYQANDRLWPLPPAPARPELGLPAEATVLCVFNQTYKITPEVFGVWMRLLAQAPRAVLWLLADHALPRANLQRQAERRRIDPARLVFAAGVPHERHLARLQAADLFLDTTPVNAHTTASDALRAGVPLVTCAGESFASRVAASLLRAAGLPELVTESLDAYEALALALLREPSRLAQLRQTLAERRAASPLFDTPHFARRLEWAYAAMWERARAGQAPVDVTVPREI